MPSFPRSELEADDAEVARHQPALRGGSWTGCPWPRCTPTTPPTAGTSARPTSSWPSARTRSASTRSASRWRAWAGGPTRTSGSSSTTPKARSWVCGSRSPTSPGPTAPTTRSPDWAGAGSATPANYQWSWQRDFFDVGNATATYMEMINGRGAHPGDAEAAGEGGVGQAAAGPLPGGPGPRRAVGGRVAAVDRWRTTAGACRRSPVPAAKASTTPVRHALTASECSEPVRPSRTSTRSRSGQTSMY